MRIVTGILTFLAVLLSAGMVFAAPVIWLLPITVLAPEIAPFVFVLSVTALVYALRWLRPAIPLLVICALVSVWPYVQFVRIRSRIADAPRTAALNVKGPARLPMNTRFYRPDDAKVRPAIIDLYGGAWQRGSPEDQSRFDRAMAARGYGVFAIDYRHAPEHRYPAQIEDVRTALRFIHQNAIKYHVDPTRFVLCGRSAGGHLALLAAYEPGAVPVRAVIAFYPPTDLVRGYADLPQPDPIDVRRVLETFMGGPPQDLVWAARLRTLRRHTAPGRRSRSSVRAYRQPC